MLMSKQCVQISMDVCMAVPMCVCVCMHVCGRVCVCEKESKKCQSVGPSVHQSIILSFYQCHLCYCLERDGQTGTILSCPLKVFVPAERIFSLMKVFVPAERIFSLPGQILS